MEEWIKKALEEFEPHPTVASSDLHPPPTSNDDGEPAPKRQKVENNRYQLRSEEEMSALSKVFVPKNTQRMTKWSVSNFMAWMTNRNKLVSAESEKCPENLLESKDPTLLNKWLGAFVLK